MIFYMCEECIYEPVNDNEKTGQDSYEWRTLSPCHDCLNTHDKPPGFMRLTVTRAKELIDMWSPHGVK